MNPNACVPAAASSARPPAHRILFSLFPMPITVILRCWDGQSSRPASGHTHTQYHLTTYIHMDYRAAQASLFRVVRYVTLISRYHHNAPILLSLHTVLISLTTLYQTLLLTCACRPKRTPEIFQEPHQYFFVANKTTQTDQVPPSDTCDTRASCGSMEV